MNCTINGQVVDCKTLGPVLSWLFPGIFVFIGLFFLIKPDWFIDYQVWSTGFFRFGSYTPGQRTTLFYRIFGLAFVIVGIFIWIYMRW